jgi:preprotein translocase subunit SecA
VSSNVLAKLFDAKIKRTDDIAAMEAEAETRHQHELEAAVARHVGEEDDQTVDPEAQLARLRQAAEGAAARPSAPPAEPRIGRNDLCPCGSGKKFKKCHGAALEDDGGDQAAV